jgi:hypothetical protein
VHIGYWWEIQKEGNHKEYLDNRWEDDIKILHREIG